MDQGTEATKGQVQVIARVQGRVLSVLRDGGRMTALQIGNRAGVTDPRGHISALRRKGIPIADQWVKSQNWGTRCKIYYLKQQ